MARTRCDKCGGTGRILGGGFVFYDCDKCDQDHMIEKVEIPIVYKRKRGRPKSETKISNETT